MRRGRLIVLGAFFIAISAAAEELGRLFFTPQERAALDVARANKAKQEPKLEAAPAQSDMPPPEIIRLNGFIRRKGGGMTVWINDAPSADYEHRRDAKLVGGGAREGAVTVQLPEGERFKLKVGQRLDAGSGEIRDPWDSRGTALPAVQQENPKQTAEKDGSPPVSERNQ